MSVAVLPVERAAKGEVRRRRLTLGLVSLAIIAVVWGALLWRSRSNPPLPVLYSLPSFSLIDERGVAFGTAQLRGKPYVADFIYTACRDSCPMLTARMGELQEQLQADPGAIRLISFTVDPQRDSPAVLADYGRRANARFVQWTFLTGPVDQVAALVKDGFRVSMEQDTARDLTHDNHFVLVDAKGQVRGYYPPTAEGLAQIRSALKELLLGG
jgi:protein SCO1